MNPSSQHNSNSGDEPPYARSLKESLSLVQSRLDEISQKIEHLTRLSERQSAKILAPYLTQEEAATRLGISPRTLRKWEQDGRVRGYCDPDNPRIKRYKLSDLDSIFESVKRGRRWPRRS